MPPTENESCRLTDSAALRIAEHQQRLIGDKTLAKTLARIVLAFHAAGLSLAPESPAGVTGQTLDLSA